MNPDSTSSLDQYDTPGDQEQNKKILDMFDVAPQPRGDWRDLVTKKFQAGWEDVAASRHAVDLMNSQVDDHTEVTKLQEGPGKPGADMLQSEYEAQPWHIRAVADAAATLPALVDTIGQGAIAGGTAAAVTGGAVAMTGNVPGALAAGATAYGYGATTGELHSIWEQSAGQMYKELRLQGVTRNTSKNLSYVFGGINSAIGMIGLKAVTGMAGKAMSLNQKAAINGVMKTPFVKQIEGNMFGRLGMTYAEHVAQGTAAGGGMSINNELTKVMAGYIEKNKPDAYTNWDSATHNVATGMLQALGASAVLAAGSTAGGFVAGEATGRMTGGAKKALQKLNVEALNNLKDSSPQEILAKLQEGLKNQPNPWDKPDESHSVAYDHNGNPIIKISTTKQQEPASKANSSGQLELTDITKAPQVVTDQMNSRAQLNADIQDGLDALFPDTKQQSFPGFNTPVEEGTQLKMPLVDWRPLNSTETQSRLNEINTNRKVLKTEIRRLESEINRQDQSGQGTFKNVERWQKVNQTLDALDSERQVLESGLGTTDIQANNYGRQRIKVLNKLFDKVKAQTEALKELALKAKAEKVDAYDKGYKSGTYQTTRAIRKIQQDLKNLAREAVHKEGNRYNQEEMVQIKQMQATIAGVTNAEQAAKAVESIRGQAVKFEEARFKNTEEANRKKVFEKVVKLIEGQSIRIQNGHTMSNMPPEVTVRLQTLRGLLKSEAALSAAEYDFETQHGSTPIDDLTPEDIDQLRIMQMARALHSGDEMSRNVSAGTIAQWVLDGKNVIKAQKEALAAEKEQHIQTALQSMRVTDSDTTHLTETSADRRNYFWQGMQAAESTWNTLLDHMSPKDPDHTLKTLLNDIEPRGKYMAMKDITEQNFFGFLRDNVAKEEHGNILQRIADNGRETYSVKYSMSEGENQTVVLTKAQMIDAILKYKDESLHDALREGNKFSLPGDVAPGESFIERIQGKLDDTDNALAAGILAFYKDYHASINEKYKEVYNVDLPQRDNYTPVSRKGYKVEPPFSKEGLQFWSLLPGSAKTRQDSKLAIQLSNPIQTALSHINQWEYWKAYTDKIRTINNVMTDPGVRAHISQEYGSGTLHVMDDFVERFMKNEAIPNEPGDSFWSAMQADIAHHALGLKPVTGFLTQLSSGINYWADYNPVQIAHGVMQSVLHPVETEQALRSSAILKHRYKEGAGVAMERAMNQGGLFGATVSKMLGHQPDVMDVNKYEAINRFIFAGYMQGDAATARLFGAPIYWAERGAGKSHAAALRIVEQIAEETQQSSSVSQTPYNGQNGNVNTMVRMFTQQPIQATGKASVYISDFFNSAKSPKDWMKLGWRMGMVWAVPGFLLGSIRATPSWLVPPPAGDDQAEEDRKRATIHDIVGSTLLGPWGGLPLIGDVLQSIWFLAAKPLIGIDESRRADYFSSNPLMEDLLNNPKDMFAKWSALNKEEDIFKAINLNEDDKKEKQQSAFNAAAMKTGTSLLGIPGQVGNIPLGLLDRASQGDTVGAALALGGWSPGALKQRQTTPENIFSPVNLNDTKQDSVYDTIQTMLGEIVKNSTKDQKFGHPQQSSKQQMDALIKGITQ